MARATGKTPAAVQFWTEGSIPDAAVMVRIAAHLGVSLSWLLTGSEAPAPLSLDNLPIPEIVMAGTANAANVNTEEYQAVPLVEGAVAAGEPIVGNDAIEGWAVVYRPLLGKRSNVVAVHVRGDSMEPVLPDGAIVIVDRGDTRPAAGRVYVVLLAGDGVTVKELQRDGDVWVMVAANRSHRDKAMKDGDRIVGRVIWSWRAW